MKRDKFQWWVLLVGLAIILFSCLSPRLFAVNQVTRVKYLTDAALSDSCYWDNDTLKCHANGTEVLKFYLGTSTVIATDTTFLGDPSGTEDGYLIFKNGVNGDIQFWAKDNDSIYVTIDNGASWQNLISNIVQMKWWDSSGGNVPGRTDYSDTSDYARKTDTVGTVTGAGIIRTDTDSVIVIPPLYLGTNDPDSVAVTWNSLQTLAGGGSTNADSIRGHVVVTTAPSDGQILKYVSDGDSLYWAADAGGAAWIWTDSSGGNPPGVVDAATTALGDTSTVTIRTYTDSILATKLLKAYGGVYLKGNSADSAAITLKQAQDAAHDSLWGNSPGYGTATDFVRTAGDSVIASDSIKYFIESSNDNAVVCLKGVNSRLELVTQNVNGDAITMHRGALSTIDWYTGVYNTDDDSTYRIGTSTFQGASKSDVVSISPIATGDFDIARIVHIDHDSLKMKTNTAMLMLLADGNVYKEQNLWSFIDTCTATLPHATLADSAKAIDTSSVRLRGLIGDAVWDSGYFKTALFDDSLERQLKTSAALAARLDTTAVVIPKSHGADTVVAGSIRGMSIADSTWTTLTAGDISSVALGNGGTGDGTTGSVTLNVVAGTSTGLAVNADSVYAAVASTTARGTASFATANFAVSAGAEVTIKSGGVTATEIATDAVGALELAANAVDSTNVADGSITYADIRDSSVTLADFYRNAWFGRYVPMTFRPPYRVPTQSVIAYTPFVMDSVSGFLYRDSSYAADQVDSNYIYCQVPWGAAKLDSLVLMVGTSSATATTSAITAIRVWYNGVPKYQYTTDFHITGANYLSLPVMNEDFDYNTANTIPEVLVRIVFAGDAGATLTVYAARAVFSF